MTGLGGVIAECLYAHSVVVETFGTETPELTAGDHDLIGRLRLLGRP